MCNACDREILKVGTEVVTPEGNNGVIDMAYQLTPAYEVKLNNGKRETWDRCVIKPIKKFNVGDEVWVKASISRATQDMDGDIVLNIPGHSNKEWGRAVHIDSVFHKQDIPK